MAGTNWYKQTTKQLFPEIEWSRPETKQSAGKLLIIGGSSFSAQAPAKSYEIAQSSGIGITRVILPSILKSTVGTALPDIYYAPSNKSGGFSKQSLAEWLEYANWADAVLLAGDIGRNSETSQTIELFLEKYSGMIAITKDTLDQFVLNPKIIFSRKHSLVVASLGQLQKMWPKLAPELTVPTLSKSIELCVNSIYELSLKYEAPLVTKHNHQLIIAFNGRVATTPNTQEVWSTLVSTKSLVWWLQNKNKPFESLVSANFMLVD